MPNACLIAFLLFIVLLILYLRSTLIKSAAAESHAIIRVHAEIRLSNWLSFCPTKAWLEPQRLKKCGSTERRRQIVPKTSSRDLVRFFSVFYVCCFSQLNTALNSAVLVLFWGICFHV